MLASPAQSILSSTPGVAPEAHSPCEITGFVRFWGFTINPSGILLALVLAALIWGLWKGQRESGANTFDFWDLIMDTLPDGKRRASIIKLSFMGAFVVSTWVLYDQDLKLSPLMPQIFTVYMGTWGLALIAKVIWDQKNMPQLKIPGTKEEENGNKA